MGIEFGARYDRLEVVLEDGTRDRGFDTFSGALGLSHDLGGWPQDRPQRLARRTRPDRRGAVRQRRAPGNAAFELGDPALSKEGAWGVEGLPARHGRARAAERERVPHLVRRLHVPAGRRHRTGRPAGLPAGAAGRRLCGSRGEVTVPLVRSGGVAVVADGKGDYIRATLADGSPVPRIPPLSLLGGLELQSARWDARAEVEWYDSQDRIAAYETPTGSYAFVNASLAWKPLRGATTSPSCCQANNLFDAEGGATRASPRTSRRWPGATSN
jgi:iron complex outermembrane receptor protein